jgi:general secretion pathway protein A
MYESHWGLTRTPFRTYLDPKAFYQSPTHEEALARLDFLVEDRRRLGLLLGDSGSGKSLLLGVFAEECRRGVGRVAANVSLLGLEPAEMLQAVATGMGLNPGPNEAIAALWQAVTDRILANRYQQLDTVLLLDDVDRAQRNVLAVVARLAQYDLTPESRLTIVLAIRREQLARLDHDLLELADLRIDVETWEETDTEGYLRETLDRAGSHSPVFDAHAVTRLHELTHGVPRKVNQLADLVLLAGAGRDLEQIDADVVESVYRELAVVEV